MDRLIEHKFSGGDLAALVGDFGMLHRVALIAIVFATFASPIRAQDAGRGACRDDIQKLCAGVERGGGRVFDCLAGQKEKLSEECRTRVESRGK
jgi:hypothetical protein